MRIDPPDDNLENDELIELINQQDHIANDDEIAVGTNDIIDQQTYIPGDEELVGELADEMGLVDSRPPDDIIAKMVNAIDYQEE